MKKIAILTAVILLFALAVVPAMAKPPTDNEHNQGPAGNSNIVHMNLVPNEGAEESWGRVKYNHSGAYLDFVLNAHNLEPNTEYVVKSKGNVLGSGITNPAGELHINGSWKCTQDLNPGRLNVRRASDNAWTLWTGSETYDVFDCSK